MNNAIFLRPDHRAELKWVFKEKEYVYPKIEFILDGPDLLARFYPALWAKKRGYKVRRLRIKNFRDRLACEILQKYPDLGRHFETGILTVYFDLGLLLYSKPITRDWNYAD